MLGKRQWVVFPGRGAYQRIGSVQRVPWFRDFSSEGDYEHGCHCPHACDSREDVCQPDLWAIASQASDEEGRRDLGQANSHDIRELTGVESLKNVSAINTG